MLITGRRFTAIHRRVFRAFVHDLVRFGVISTQLGQKRHRVQRAGNVAASGAISVRLPVVVVPQARAVEVSVGDSELLVTYCQW